jgi:hypothetical protein
MIDSHPQATSEYAVRSTNASILTRDEPSLPSMESQTRTGSPRHREVPVRESKPAALELK